MNDLELLTPNNIFRTRRKSISLIIKNNGEFIVRAPLKSTDADIFKFINKKVNWIIKKRREKQANQTIPLRFDKPEKITILGNIYDLAYEDNNKVKICENKIVLPKQNPKEKLVTFLKKKTNKYLTERVKHIAKTFHFNYASISVSSAKTRWGSCNYKNKLNFTYRLILCPVDVVDYIILHELCHTKVKNHSKKFWAEVEKCLPDYKIQEKWLKTNKTIIEII